MRVRTPPPLPAKTAHRANVSGQHFTLTFTLCLLFWPKNAPRGQTRGGAGGQLWQCPRLHFTSARGLASGVVVGPCHLRTCMHGRGHPVPAPLGTLRLGRANLRTGQKTPHALSAAVLDPDARALSALWFGETRIVEYGAWCAGTTSAQRAAAVGHRVPPPFVRLSGGNSCWRALLPSLSDASRFRLPYGARRCLLWKLARS